ncbi:hypothetical protein [Aminivibrio sp.]|uniref:hypothetical protein n=1 Tax=Aminivibrio sp. TaxID=1872489 RepID=UPI00345EEC8E
MKLLLSVILIFALFFSGVEMISGAPAVEALLKTLPRFEGWKMESPFSMPEDEFVTVGADYSRGDRSFQFMVIAGPEAPSAGPLPEELEEDRTAGSTETAEAWFSFFSLGGFPAVKIEMKDESGATVWIDLESRGWLLLGGDGMKGDEIVKLLGKVNLKEFARLVR